MNQTLKTTNLIRCLTSFNSSINSRCILSQQLHQLNQNFNLLNHQSNLDQQKRTITRGRVKVLREMKARANDYYIEPHKLRHRNEWLDWNYDCEIFAFNQRLKEKFNEISLKRAFISKSHSYTSSIKLFDDDNPEKSEEIEILDQIEKVDNEEFIEAGRALCDRFINSYLRYFLRHLPEEGIESIKQYLLSDKPLADMARKIGCEELILCKEFPVSEKTLANTMLSLIGALLNDTDEKHTTKFIIDFILTYLQPIDIMDIWEIDQPDRLLEQILAANEIGAGFEYRLLRETGANTIIPSYLIGVYCNKKLLGFGPGSSIEEGKEMAVLDALRRIFNLNAANQLFKFGEKVYDLDFHNYSKPNLFIKDYKVSHLDRFKDE